VPWNESLPCALFGERSQPFFFLVAKAESQVIGKIAAAKFMVEFAFLGNHLIDIAKIDVVQPSQLLSDLFDIRHFWPNEPERKNKRQAGCVLPRLRKVPKFKIVCVSLPKVNCLIADQQQNTVALYIFRRGRNEARMQIQFIQ